MCSRISSATALWRDLHQQQPEGQVPSARWIRFKEIGMQQDVRLSSSPIAVDDLLNNLLWERCFASVITSATLSVGGDFSRFAEAAEPAG